MHERQQITCSGSFIPPFFELLEFPECNVRKFVKNKIKMQVYVFRKVSEVQVLGFLVMCKGCLRLREEWGSS